MTIVLTALSRCDIKISDFRVAVLGWQFGKQDPEQLTMMGKSLSHLRNFEAVVQSRSEGWEIPGDCDEIQKLLADTGAMVVFFAQSKDLHSLKLDLVTFGSAPPDRTYERRYPATLTQLISSQVDWPLRQLELRVFETPASAFIAVIKKYRITLKNLGFSDVCLTGRETRG